MFEKKNFTNLCLEKQLISRQYYEGWKFFDYNEVIKKLQCNHILSFNNCLIPSDLQDDHDVPVSTCKFSNKCKDILAVANENGIVCIENVKNVETLKYVQAHKNTVYDMAWMPGNTQFVTVSGDNSAKLWDCDSNINLLSTFMGHKRSVRCVSFKPDNTAVFATGSRDGSLMIWDARAWKKCAMFSHHLPDQIISLGAGSPSPAVKKNSFSVELLNCRSVTGLVFQNDNTLISCGSMDNSVTWTHPADESPGAKQDLTGWTLRGQQAVIKFIRVWDMRKTYSRSSSNVIAKYHLASPNSGFSYLSMNALGTKLYANCMDSYIYCFNINSYDPDPVAAFYGHTNGSFYVKSSVSLDGLYLMSGSSDEAAYIWNTRNAELSEEAMKPFIVLNSHTAEVTCVEMSSDNMVVVTCSDDGTFRLWNPYKLKNKIEERIETAAIYDLENVPVVKTKWKNKRKFRELEESDSNNSKVLNCLSHTKICRFYTLNHASACICQEKFIQGKGEKRPNESYLQEIIANKRTARETQTQTLGNYGIKNSFSAHFEIKTAPKPRADIKPCSKRKLEETFDFKDEVYKSKKMTYKSILTPLNSLEERKNNSLESEDTQESQKKTSDDFTNEYFKQLLENKNSEAKTCLLTFSSPTSNLPNYVEDGTSPYIHKCPKIIQKENDWLTKLRKTYKRAKISDGKLLNPVTVSPVLEKRKRSKPIDCTLHKYFKVSSKGTERSFNAQEIQKKSILAKVEN